MSDDKTLQYYQHHVSDLFARYESVASPLAQHFALAFRPGSRVLDVGCGSGRDLKALLAAGYDAFGVEPVLEMRDLALAQSPALQGRIDTAQLPEITSTQAYDGILCSAVLMHIPAGEQLEAFINLRDLLVVGGRLLLSVPHRRTGLDDNYRDADGRLFLPLDADRIRLIAEQLGLVLLSQSTAQDSLGRAAMNWDVLLFEKTSAANRPLDRIESVLKHDRKVATYKLALLRAFCDVADRDSEAVVWYGNGEVGISVRVLAECWLRYYWPLIAAPVHIPQSNNDKPDSRKPHAFRKSLALLIKLCKDDYGVEANVVFTLFMIAVKKILCQRQSLSNWRQPWQPLSAR